MKIALVRKEFDALRGGAERYGVNLARGLADLGHSVTLFCGRSTVPDHPNVTVRHVPYTTFFSPLKNLSFNRNSARQVAAESFDIVNGLAQIFPQDVYRVGDPLHVHFLRTVSLTPRKRAVKYLNPRHLALLYLERKIFKPGHYNRIITNSAMSKTQVMKYYGVPEQKISVVRNGVDTDRFHPGTKAHLRKSIRENLGIQDRETVLLFAGNDFRRKGLQFAMQLTAELLKRGRHVRLLVAGKGNPRPYLRLIRKNGYQDHILFMGHAEKIETLYGASDLFVLPTFYDPFANVCLEAMACGLPVITTRQNGAAEIIEDRVSGILVDRPWQLAEMTDAAAALIENRGSGLRDMGEKALAVAGKNTLAKNIEQTLAVYKAVLTEKKAG